MLGRPKRRGREGLSRGGFSPTFTLHSPPPHRAPALHTGRVTLRKFPKIEKIL